MSPLFNQNKTSSTHSFSLQNMPNFGPNQAVESFCRTYFLHILRPTQSKMCHCGFVLHMSYSSSWILIPIIIVQNWCAAGKLIGKSFPIGKDSSIKNFHNWHIPNISQVIEKQKVCVFKSYDICFSRICFQYKTIHK